MGWVFVFPCCVSFYLWSCIIPRERMNGCEWVTFSQCFAYPMMRHWHQRMSTQPMVAAACDSYQLRIFTRVHKHTQSRTHPLTHTQRDQKQPCMILILIPFIWKLLHVTLSEQLFWMGGRGCLYTCGGVWVIWFNLTGPTAVCVLLLYLSHEQTGVLWHSI